MKKLALLCVLLCCAAMVSAQQGAFFSIEAQKHVKLPWGASQLSIVDGRLYCINDGVVLSSPLTDDGVLSLQPDTVVGRLDDNIAYVVRNPRDSSLYFTTTDKSGIQHLMMRPMGKNRNKRVDLGGWKGTVVHPTFSPDGNVVVFSSLVKVGMGGFDLWCSVWNGHKWSKPVNMGSIINTMGNEISPTFLGNHLVFASDVANQGFKLYSVRVLPCGKVDDIIFGKYFVRALPNEMNAVADNMDMAVDTLHHRGYWISSRNGRDELFVFKGRLEGVTLSGKVINMADEPLQGAEVKAFYKGREVASTTTDAAGLYNLFVQSGYSYQVKITKEDYYTFNRTVAAQRVRDDFLMAVDSQNVMLHTLQFGKLILLDDVFAQGVAVELSSHDMEALQFVVDFVRDNPQVKTTFIFYYDETDDMKFNNMVIEQRISCLRNYLQSVLPSRCSISYLNASPEEENGEEFGGTNAIFVLFNK